MTGIIEVFKKEASATQENIEDLKEKVKDLVFDLKTPEGFKAAKDTRAECKSITDKISRIAIDTKNEIDGERKKLTKEVEGIYSGITSPLKIEEDQRKADKKKLDDKKKAAEQAIRDSIDGIRAFAHDLYSKTSQEVQETIEAISTIDVTQFGKLQDEAKRVKKETIDLLGGALPLIIQKENTPKVQPIQKPAPEVTKENVWAPPKTTLHGKLLEWMEVNAIYGNSAEELLAIIEEIKN